MNNLKKAIRESIAGQLFDDAGMTIGLSFHIRDDFIGFAGHFPGQPIMPAIAQIIMAAVTLEEMLSRTIIIQRVQNAKFKRPVLPETRLTVEITFGDDPGNGYSVRILHGNDMVSSFRLFPWMEDYDRVRHP